MSQKVEKPVKLKGGYQARPYGTPPEGWVEGEGYYPRGTFPQQPLPPLPKGGTGARRCSVVTLNQDQKENDVKED